MFTRAVDGLKDVLNVPPFLTELSIVPKFFNRNFLCLGDLNNVFISRGAFQSYWYFEDFCNTYKKFYL